MTYTVGVVGTGDPDEGYAMAYRHARAYERLDNCDLVACADLVEEHAAAFAETFGLGDDGIFGDHTAMLDDSDPDIVSVCTPSTTHADLVTDCAEHGAVEAIHCEKPMAGTWGECREMVAVASGQGVQLTFNHQRRFSEPFRGAKRLLDAGRIGSLRRLEVGGPDLYDYGSHLFDMCGYLTEQTPVEWVLGQVDDRDPERLYGLPRERRALGRWRYESCVDGFASTGEDGLVRCQLRLVGTDGVIEVGPTDGPSLRVSDDGADWSTVDTGRDGIWRVQSHPVDRLLARVPIGPDQFLSDPTYVDRAIESIVESLQSGEKPMLHADHALQSTEVIFALWESARSGGVVELPLDIEDNPLESMVADLD